MVRISILTLFLTLIFASVPAFAFGSKFETVTVKPDEFSIDQVLNDVYALVDSENVKLFKNKNENMDNEIIELFDVSILRSKLEQFYTMLFYISKYA